MFPWVDSTLVIHVVVSLINPWEFFSITACNGFQVALVMAALEPGACWYLLRSDLDRLIWYAALMQSSVCVCMNVILTSIESHKDQITFCIPNVFSRCVVGGIYYNWLIRLDCYYYYD